MKLHPAISRIADRIIRTAQDDYQYIHDPDHRNRPHGTFWPTGRGWSNDPKHNPKNKQTIVPRGTNLTEEESYNRALKYFDPKALETAKTTSENPKSRERLIFMSPAEFLSVAKPLHSAREDSVEAVKSSAESGKKWSDIPYLYFSHDGKGIADVDGHEGRHRAMYLQSIGEPVMPVAFISDSGGDGSAIRWGEQEKPDSYDRIDQKWPKVLRQEDGGGIIPFPVGDLRTKNVPRGTNPVDVSYFEAVNSGNMEAVHRMVEEKAKASGYSEIVKHATPFTFNEFKREMASRSDPDTNVVGFHVGSHAEEFSPAITGTQDRGVKGKTKILNLFVNLGDTIKRRDAEKIVRNQISQEIDSGQDSISDDATFPKGYDTVVFSNPPIWTNDIQREFDKTGVFKGRDNYLYKKDQQYNGVDLCYTNGEYITGYMDLKEALDPELTGGSHFVIKNPNQIKSADPIVKDDQGNIIPLSQRFNPQSNDIRY